MSLKNLSNDISFVIFQVHAQYYPMEIYQARDFLKNSSIYGTNIALYSEHPKEPFFIANHEKKPIQILIAVHAYLQKDPIPGGCSMEQKSLIVPFMNIEYNDFYVQVSAPPAKSPLDPKCINSVDVNLHFFVMYLPGMKYDAKSYFDAIKQMMSLQGIMEKATEVPLSYWRARRKVCRYQGTSRVFVAIASNQEGYSLYAPIFEQGCDYDDCFMGNLLYWYVYILMLGVGFVLCYFGRRLFYWSYFCITFSLVYVLIYMFGIGTDFENEFTWYYAPFICGLVLMWYWLWNWFMGRSPFCALLVSMFAVGWLLSAFLYYRFGDVAVYLVQNRDFWCMFGVVSFLTMLLICWAPDTCIVCSPILGSYMFIFALSQFTGSNLKFVVINVLRRATMPNFNKVLLMVPMQNIDKIFFTLMIVMAFSGLIFQYAWYRCGLCGQRPLVPVGCLEKDPPGTQRMQRRRRQLGLREDPETAQEANERTPLLS